MSKTRRMTIAIEFKDGQEPGDLNFDSVVNGGTVTAMANYDLFDALEVAEDALNECGSTRCMDALDTINEKIKQSHGS